MSESIEAAAPAEAVRRDFLKRVLFPFAFVFVLVMTVPFPLDRLVGYVQRASQLEIIPKERRSALEAVAATVTKGFARVDALWDERVLDFADRVHGKKITVRPNGSGDTTWNYIDLEMRAIIAGILGAIWLFLGRRKPAFPRLGRFLSIYVRWNLLLTMFGYGFFKVVPVQMPYPRLASLLTTYADSSPMGLVWRFIGLSPAYSMFTGLGEVVGGLLLAFRRTTLLGAVVVVAVMSNVVFLNYAYDIPVKLYSSFLLVQAMGLLFADRERLIAFFVTNGATAAAPLSPLFGRRFIDQAVTVMKFAVVAGLIYEGVTGAREVQEKYADRRMDAPFYGVKDVVSFRRDGVEVPLLVTDETLWRQMIGDNDGMMAVRRMDDRQVYFGFEPDAAKGEIAWTDFSKPPEPESRPASAPASRPESAPASAPAEAPRGRRSIWKYHVIAPDMLEFEGDLDGHHLVVRVKERAVKIPIRDRGYHWINEYPFNR